MQTNGCGCRQCPITSCPGKNNINGIIINVPPTQGTATQTPGPGNTSPTTNHKQKLGAGVQLRKSFEEMLENGDPPLAGAGSWCDTEDVECEATR